MSSVPPTAAASKPEVGFWGEAWRRYRRRPLAMLALGYVVLLCLVAVLSPVLVGTKPLVCKYKGQLYFPALGYYHNEWENGIFTRDRFRNLYKQKLAEKDPESWAVWPLVFQDPLRRVRADEWPGRPANPTRDQGRPNQYNLLGTNREGVDVLAQLVHGARSAVLVGFVTMGIAATIGIVLGGLAGYFGGWIDLLLSRLIEVVMCVPQLVLILALIAVLAKPTIWHVMAVLGLTSWTGIARLTRGEFLRLREADFVTAARAAGAPWYRIMIRHIFRNAMAPVLVPVSFGIASAILIESALSFLGFGTAQVSWGELVSDGRSNLSMWWLVVFPGAAIFFTVLAYNLIGEGLQDATDPRLRQAQ